MFDIKFGRTDINLLLKEGIGLGYEEIIKEDLL
jgi:hypothetical protein